MSSTAFGLRHGHAPFPYSSQPMSSYIILGGDFNVDLSRNWANTKVLEDYCLQACLSELFAINVVKSPIHASL